MRKLKKLNNAHVNELKAFIKDNKNLPCEIKRAQAIISLHNNLSTEDINDLVGLDKSSVFKIRKKYMEKGIKIVFAHNKDDVSDIVFDFGYYVEDYRVSREGRRLDHHMSNLPERWIFVEVKDSEYLKKLNEEADGILLFIDPDLKHYMAGDVDSSVDIISRSEPKVYKVKSLCKPRKKNKK